MTRIFLVEPLTDQNKVELLSKHGELFPLTEVATYPMPAVWNTYEMSKWIQDAMEVLKSRGQQFDYKKDYLALVGNMVALANLLVTVAVWCETPYSVRCLSYSRKNSDGEYAHVCLEEYVPT